MPGSLRGGSAPLSMGAPASGKRVAGRLFVVCHFLSFSGFFNLHVAELLGVKDLATLQALDKLHVFVPGNDTYPGVLADGCHCLGIIRPNSSFRKIVAIFSVIWNGFLVNLCARGQNLFSGA